MKRKEPKNWKELAERLLVYAAAVGTLGGLNGLDKALVMASEAIKMYAPPE